METATILKDEYERMKVQITTRRELKRLILTY